MPIREDVIIGHGTKVWHPELVNFYGCEIGNDCNVGCFVEIGPQVKIGNRVKIESKVYIATGVEIEDDVFIGPDVTFLNDKHPPSPKETWVIMRTLVRRGAAIGGGALIMPGLTLGERCVIGAGAVVTKDVKPGDTVVGVPARIHENNSH